MQIYQPSHCHPHQISCAKKDGGAHCTTASERDSRAEGEGAVPRREAAKKHNDATRNKAAKLRRNYGESDAGTVRDLLHLACCSAAR